MLVALDINMQKDENRDSWRRTSCTTSIQNSHEQDVSTVPLPTIAEIGPTQIDNGEECQNEIASVSNIGESTSENVDDSDADPDYSDSQSSSLSTDMPSTEEDRNGEDNRKPKSRKRKAVPEKWKRNQSKLLRNTGKSYKSLNTKKEVSARKLCPPCDMKCRLRCSTTFTDEERMNIFDKYWALGDINSQRSFILQSTQHICPRYRQSFSNTGQPARKLNNAFYFQQNKERLRVCKKFFRATLGISNRCIRTVMSKSEDGFLLNDLRGKHQNHVQVSEAIKQGIRAHISSIPVLESHYTRETFSKQYIEGGKTIAQLYRDYKEACEEQGKPVGNLTMYTRIFNYEFNLEFFSPKKDQCQQCASYMNLNENDRNKAKTEFDRHIEEKELSRKEKKTDKNCINSSFQVSCFDLQAALPTPCGEISSFYYKFKLSTYNFTICDLKKDGPDDVYCYLWHEGDGKKGATEIGTCLLKFLEQKAATCKTDELEITLYSDNCCGQQKNKYVVACYLYAVAKFQIKKITHKFLIVGHTQNEGDCVHSIIEKTIKRSLKFGPIYVPAQYASLIRIARKKGKPFQLFEMGHDDFVDVKDLTDRTSNNFVVNNDNDKVLFNSISVLKIEKQSLDCFFYKTSFKETDFKTVNVKTSRSRRSLQSFQDATVTKSYSKPLPIPKKKFDDLQSLIASNAVPKCYSTFYNSLTFEL